MRQEQERGRAGSRSRGKLLTAVTELLDQRDPAEISITDVVGVAGVTRPTFYAAFADLPSLFAAAASARLEEAFADVVPTPGLATAPEVVGSAITSILRRLDAHAEFFRRVLDGPGGQQLNAQIVAFVAMRLRTVSPLSPALAAGPIPIRESTTAIAAGVVWLMQEWLDEETRRPVDDIAGRLHTFIVRTVLGGLGGDPSDAKEVNR